MTPVRLEPAASRSRVKHSTIEPLRSLLKGDDGQAGRCLWCSRVQNQVVVHRGPNILADSL